MHGNGDDGVGEGVGDGGSSYLHVNAGAGFLTSLADHFLNWVD